MAYIIEGYLNSGFRRDNINCKSGEKKQNLGINSFIIKQKSETSGYVRIGTTTISFPQELVGKRVRFKLEIIN